MHLLSKISQKRRPDAHPDLPKRLKARTIITITITTIIFQPDRRTQSFVLQRKFRAKLTNYD
jgi:hypothetical protein